MTMLRRLLPLALLVPLALSGCDTAETNGEDDFPLTNERPAGFTYNATELNGGDSFSGSDEQDSQEIINDSRFEPSDISSARIDGPVELNMDFPFGPENEVLINEATLTLSAEGVAPQVVARREDFTLAINSTTAPQRQGLTLVDADIADFLRQERFIATLTLDVAEASGEDYQFTARFNVDASVTVEAANRAAATR